MSSQNVRNQLFSNIALHVRTETSTTEL